MEVVEHFQNNSHIVVNGFKHACIHHALGILTDESDEEEDSEDEKEDLEEEEED